MRARPAAWWEHWQLAWRGAPRMSICATSPDSHQSGWLRRTAPPLTRCFPSAILSRRRGGHDRPRPSTHHPAIGELLVLVTSHWHGSTRVTRIPKSSSKESLLASVIAHAFPECNHLRYRGSVSLPWQSFAVTRCREMHHGSPAR